MAMNFTVNLTEQVVEVRVGNDMILRRIQEDDKGNKFFSVPNLLNNPTQSKVNQFFTKRIKDAIETIRNGDGDVLRVDNVFGIVNVLYFLDRSYGATLREKNLKGWENAKFAYSISYQGISELDIENDFFSSATPTKYFDTESEATKHLSELREVAVQYAKKYEALDEDGKNIFWADNTFSFAIEKLLLFEIERSKNPNVICPLCVVQTVCKE